MERLNEQMRQDQVEIDRLKAETRVIADHSSATLRNLLAQLDALQKGK